MTKIIAVPYGGIYIYSYNHKMKTNKIDWKKQILEAGKQQHQSVIDDYTKKIKELRETKAAANDESLDLQELSFNNEVNDKINHLAEQLNFAVDEMNLLNRIQVIDPLHETVTLGSVVETDHRSFFVSVSIEDFEVAGQKYFGLSQKTPLYKEMAGKKTGDSFSFGKTHYKILDVY